VDLPGPVGVDGGSVQERDAGEAGSYTIVLQCGNTTSLPLKVVGHVTMDARDFLSSNCSVHGANAFITVKCPRADLKVSSLAKSAERYLQVTSTKTES
jgi:hypothetical protein